MKKIILGSLIVVTLITSTTVVNALSTNYQDNNNDGICDNQNTNTNYQDNNNDGICDNKENKSNYSDNNNDGICDNMNKNNQQKHRKYKNKK